MTKFPSVPIILFSIFFSSLSACKKYQAPSGEATYSSSLSSQKVDCKPGRNYIAKSDSTISWRATKITPAGAEEVLLGTNKVAASLRRGESWKTASAKIDIAGTSTNSDDPMRDTRINSFVFDVQNSVPFGFKVTKIEGDFSNSKAFETQNVTAVGILFIGSQEVEIRIPVLIKEFVGSLTVTPSSMFKLNVRSLSPVVNGVNLVEQIERLLTYVPGVKMKDDVYIDFLLEFTDLCR